MQVNVAPAAVVRGQMEDNAGTLNRFAGKIVVFEVTLEELYPTLIEVPLDILLVSAA